MERYEFREINRDLPEAEQPNYDVHRLFGTINAEEKSYLPLEGYIQSKVANVLFGIASNKRLYDKHGILSLAVHPVKTELSRYAPPETKAAIQEMLKGGAMHVKTSGAGSATTLVAATDPRLGLPMTRSNDGRENYGAYLSDCQISDKACARAVSSDEAEKLWKLSEALVNEKFAW